MKSPTDFATHLTAFLTGYLPLQRSVSPHTIKAYRDAFRLFLRFCRDEHGLAPEQLRLAQIDAPLVLAFLEHTEHARHCTARTRNHRLAALHAFFRYVQTEEPDLILACQRILAIPCQRHESRVVGYLSAEDLAVIFQQPDLTTREGRRDAVLLSLLYDTAARVQELIDLSPRDVSLESPSQVRLTGKGRKQRVVPLMDSTVALLREYLQEYQLHRPERLDVPLFANRHGGRLSRSGVRYILAKHTTTARSALQNPPQTISPHTLRHTKAMHLLQTGAPLVIIRDILGHTDLKSTEIYAHADQDMKRQALNKASEISPTPTLPSWQQNKDLMEWLNSL
jgi:site-specific recombinase XerD